jgi:rSAM/selenodomain-associated transferase 1
MIRRALMVVAKKPAPGQTKTRLSPPLRTEEAAALYECFLRDTLEIIRVARKTLEFQPIIAYLGDEDYFRHLAPDFDLRLQEGADLSERLNHATTYCLTQDGYDQTVIMDSDSPTLPSENLCRAFTTLDDGADISLGPCDDGGYYLIGLKRPSPNLFLNVTMSTPHVVADTLAQAKNDNLRVAMLPICYDIDLVDDLQRLIRDLETLPDHVARHTRAFLAEKSALLQAIHKRV